MPITISIKMHYSARCAIIYLIRGIKLHFSGESMEPDKVILKRLASRLKQLRLNIPDMTQKRAAELSGLSERTIKSIESGQSSMNMLSIIALARTYNVTAQIENLFPVIKSPMATLHGKGTVRQRARASNKQTNNASVKAQMASASLKDESKIIWGEDKPTK